MKTPEEIVEELKQCFVGNGDYYFTYIDPEDCLTALKQRESLPMDNAVGSFVLYREGAVDRVFWNGKEFQDFKNNCPSYS